MNTVSRKTVNSTGSFGQLRWRRDGCGRRRIYMPLPVVPTRVQRVAAMRHLVEPALRPHFSSVSRVTAHHATLRHQLVILGRSQGPLRRNGENVGYHGSSCLACGRVDGDNVTTTHHLGLQVCRPVLKAGLVLSLLHVAET
eukprot:CAMPEP_0198682156 /NCGR_PEP_ID=MMETSP1468-20131203/8194_1 /TAXON_ID=1461545 /ORGANISM="Mantoniella sp, Strain CCMP1436" /LENGTH=140 /DNA_ID=CAMNT_0044424771 /DNA_START=90 /DNA_END=512 /DNA_ORIENTATION=+